MTVDYKNTVFLPKTDFPMRANLAEREKEHLKTWESLDLYQEIRKASQGKKKFILHYGPPYANGHIHIGHALSEILKDVLNKIKQMQGFDAPLVPGWDCHGLPIEWQIEKEYQAKGKSKDDVPAIEFRKECRAYASKWIDIQREEFKRLGIMGDWKNPYSTMDFQSEAKIVEEISKLAMGNLLYRGLKPVMWSVVEKTALAEAEVEYKDHVSDAIYVAFPIVKTNTPAIQDAHFVIWTTTPWSLPGNRAIAYGHFHYLIIEVEDAENKDICGKKFIIAEDLLEDFLTSVKISAHSIDGRIEGQSFEGTHCHHPLRHLGYTFDVPLFFGEHVTIEAGTGLVHTAPSHGLEDFILGQTHNLEVPETVGEDGLYTSQAPHFKGIHVYKANTPIIEALKESGTLVHHNKITHSYPHSWRSKAPLIYRAAQQWFVDVQKIRESAVKAIGNTRFVPESGRSRILSMVENRPDWCISRQRAWGTPITLFVHKETKEVLRDADVFHRIIQQVKEHGVDVWFTASPETFLGQGYNANDFEQVFDVADVWLDSGCTHTFVLEDRKELSWPADVYLEGSDQHRGWFQSSLLHGVATRNRAPYKEIVTHGFVLDEKGYKMSKSQGNGMTPEEVINTYGADILRLWVASVDYSDDVRIGKDILKQLEDIYRRFRNTLRYLLGALDGFQKSEELPFDRLPELEKVMLHKLFVLQKKAEDVGTSYDFADFYNTLHQFCTSDLSAFYFDIRKDCLYCDPADSLKRRATRTVMNIILDALIKWLAPVLSFTAEEAYLFKNPDAKSVHLEVFPEFPVMYENEALFEKWEKIRTYRSVMTGAIEVERAAKTIGSSLQAELTIYTSPEIMSLFEGQDVAEIAITSKAKIIHAQPSASAFMLDNVENMGVVVTKAEHHKCERCWKVLEEVTPPKMLCNRCNEAVTS